jgi:hypothetical protein
LGPDLGFSWPTLLKDKAGYSTDEEARDKRKRQDAIARG